MYLKLDLDYKITVYIQSLILNVREHINEIGTGR